MPQTNNPAQPGPSATVFDRRQVEEELRIERENLRAIFASSPVGMLLLDADMNIVNTNAVIARLVARDAGRIIRQRAGNGLGCVHGLEDARGCGFSQYCPQCPLRRAVLSVLETGASVHGAEIQVALQINGQERRPWLRVSAEPVQLHGRKHVIVAIDDVTERKLMEDQLRAAACTDILTGLPNRAVFSERLQQAILRSRRLKDYHFAVLFVDFDRFKTVNDSFGHGMGDLLLREMAHRLRAVVRAGDTFSRMVNGNTAARLGGDEFVVLLDGISGPDDAKAVAQRLLELSAQPCRLGGHEVSSTVSIGLVTSDVSCASAGEVLRDADTAMYEAKLAGKARCAVFEVAMRQRLQNRLDLETDLRHALRAEQLFIMYQPIISLQTGQIESFEALLRWQHPQRGMIAPDEFIGIAEDTGLILPIGEWVLRAACCQFAQWRQAAFDAAPRSISVNLSRKQLLVPDLPATVGRILRETGVTPECLHLEVTESTMMTNAPATTGILRAIKNIGVKLDMDDFGTGYSSLSCLHQFPIDMLKIDRSFVANINRGRDFAALVQAVAQLARNLRINVVAEGIENLEQAMVLQSLDCEFGQGYLFSKPMRAQDVLNFKVHPAALPGAPLADPLTNPGA